MNRAPGSGAKLRDLIDGVYIFKGSLVFPVGRNDWLVWLEMWRNWCYGELWALEGALCCDEERPGSQGLLEAPSQEISIFLRNIPTLGGTSRALSVPDVTSATNLNLVVELIHLFLNDLCTINNFNNNSNGWHHKGHLFSQGLCIFWFTSEKSPMR